MFVLCRHSAIQDREYICDQPITYHQETAKTKIGPTTQTSSQPPPPPPQNSHQLTPKLQSEPQLSTHNCPSESEQNYSQPLFGPQMRHSQKIPTTSTHSVRPQRCTATTAHIALPSTDISHTLATYPHSESQHDPSVGHHQSEKLHPSASRTETSGSSARPEIIPNCGNLQTEVRWRKLQYKATY